MLVEDKLTAGGVKIDEHTSWDYISRATEGDARGADWSSVVAHHS